VKDCFREVFQASWVTGVGRDLPAASRCITLHRMALVEVIVRVVGALDSAELATQTALGHFAAGAEGRDVGPHGAAQVVQGEMFQSVLTQPPRARPSTCR